MGLDDRRGLGLGVYTWPNAAMGGTACYSYGAWINSCVHVIMYSYYGLTAVNIRPPVILKKSVTTVQLSQFFSCLVHALCCLLFDSTPLQYVIVQFAYHVLMMYLFI